MIRPTAGRRPAERTRISLRARLTWKDTSGALRFASVVTRDVSESGAFVETDSAVSIPLYRLVHLQIERDIGVVKGVPQRLGASRVLSAVWRVGPCRRATGTPEGYALRFLVAPTGAEAATRPVAVAS